MRTHKQWTVELLQKALPDDLQLFTFEDRTNKGKYKASLIRKTGEPYLVSTPQNSPLEAALDVVDLWMH